MILYWSSVIAALLSMIGCSYLVWTIFLIGRLPRNVSHAPRTAMPGVTILKPLHGAGSHLIDNLSSFCEQNYPGPVQIIFGVQNASDDVVAIVQRLRHHYGADRVDLVIDGTIHGLNGKVSNLINMWRRVEHEIVVLADSDMRVGPNYLSTVVIALQERGVGAVTCPYHGLAARGLWSRFAELGINANFLPNLILGVTVGLAQPCLGSTIAFRRKALEEVGGFVEVADSLADDHAIGARLRAQGHGVAVLSMTIGHVCDEPSAVELWQHEVRWARTIRTITPAGYVGLTVTHAFPLALIAALAGIAAGSVGPAAAVGLCTVSLGFRLALLKFVERSFRLPPQRYCLLPLRDLLSFAVFLCGFAGRSVRWKGREYRFTSNGTLLAKPLATLRAPAARPRCIHSKSGDP